MAEQYVLDPQGCPVPEPDLLRWAEWFEHADRTLAYTSVPDDEHPRAWVSTVFLGLNHQWGNGEPVLWETMAFLNQPTHLELPDGQTRTFDRTSLDGTQQRYTSREAALLGHALMVEQVRAMVSLES